MVYHLPYRLALANQLQILLQPGVHAWCTSVLASALEPKLVPAFDRNSAKEGRLVKPASCVLIEQPLVVASARLSTPRSRRVRFHPSQLYVMGADAVES